MEKEKLYIVYKYVLFLIIFVLLGYTQIGILNSFMFGMFFCLIWCNQKLYILIPLYILANFICYGINETYCINCVCTIGTMLVAYFFHNKFNKPFSITLLTLYAVFSQVLSTYFTLYGSINFFGIGINLLLGIVAMLCYISFFQSVMIGGIKRKFAISEGLYGAVFLMLLVNGWINISSYSITVLFGAFTCLSLILIWCYGVSPNIVIATICGFGVALSTKNLVYVAFFVGFAIVPSIFKNTKKIYSCISIVLFDALIQLMFLPTLSYYEILSVTIGAFIFLLIKDKDLSMLSSLFINDKEDFAIKNLLNREKDSLYKKLQNLSNIFYDMQNAFYEMAQKSISNDQIKDMLKNSIKNEICATCHNKSTCLRTFENETEYAFNNMVSTAYNRGKVNIMDVPTSLSCRCGRLGAVINNVNKNVINYIERKQILDSSNQSKMVISNQLNGIAKIMSNLSNTLATKMLFDEEKSKTIVESLSLKQILCIDAVVYQTSNKYYCADLTIRNSDLDNFSIIAVVSEILGQSMSITKIYNSNKQNFSILHLNISNTFNMVFGCSGAKKNGSEQSGDTYSITKIGNTKYVMALCDGMGSGNDAERNSSLAMSLIENFYKAGFDSDDILDCVNKLLSQSGEDKFNAIDIGVVDLINGNCEIYKLGSPSCFIKQDKNVEILQTNALPLGILEQVKPTTYAKILLNGDMVVFVSDGIVDCFGDENVLKEYIAINSTTNPQVLSDNIIDECLKMNKYNAKDDMTILIGRIYRV